MARQAAQRPRATRFASAARVDTRREPEFPTVVVSAKGSAMKIATAAFAAVFVLSGTIASGTVADAQTRVGSPQARPTPSTNSTRDQTGMAPTTSGSGTSSSGGSDANGDQGLDKMPQSSTAVKPQPGKPNIPDPTNKK